jgi:hypothetical protein
MELTDLGLRFTLHLRLEEKDGDTREAFDTEDVAQRPSLGHSVT